MKTVDTAVEVSTAPRGQLFPARERISSVGGLPHRAAFTPKAQQLHSAAFLR